VFSLDGAGRRVNHDFVPADAGCEVGAQALGILMDPFRLFAAPVIAILREQVLPFLAGLGAVVAAGVAGAYWLGRRKGRR